ncbi:hypothetical protein SAMN05660865_00789 [Caloramator fervidus]|uniref:Phosphoesterase n=1 Tax=Caloramator fervidus TaxID=29344 RepID=A0A1H5U5T3_9CLOT|nr:phosphodiesterase [Caloramator fervidus]SEF70386.1 hypothetical protein SAMN05660865_00789 [Caloramator fervidus]
MKIGVISDVHGYPEKLDKALDYLKDCEVILCTGDVLYHGPRNPILEGYNPLEVANRINNSNIPIIIAQGNCDSEVDAMVLDIPFFSPCVFYEKNGLRILVLHGHDVEDEKLYKLSKFYKANIIITGHTHIRRYENKNGVIYLNPGSISVPKGDGVPSFIKIEDNEIKFLNLNGEIIEKFKL